MDNNKKNIDIDIQETQEWTESLRAVIENQGPERAHFLVEKMMDFARRNGAKIPYKQTTAYLNTIPVSQQVKFGGDRTIERRIKSLIRWNAMAMVVRANKESPGIGGHISSYSSAATLYEVG